MYSPTKYSSCNNHYYSPRPLLRCWNATGHKPIYNMHTKHTNRNENSLGSHWNMMNTKMFSICTLLFMNDSLYLSSNGFADSINYLLPGRGRWGGGRESWGKRWQWCVTFWGLWYYSLVAMILMYLYQHLFFIL